MMSSAHTTSPRGYTLLELIVAVGLFSMVMLIVTGVYLALVSYDRQARATNELVANLSFAVESMVRTIRTGSKYHAGGVGDIDCATAAGSNGSSNDLTFCDSQGTRTRYRLNGDGTIGLCTDAAVAGCSDGTSSKLTSDRIEVQTLTFYVRGVGTGGANSTVQPQVTIVIKGVMNTDAGEEIAFSIQTSGTQRLLDIP